MTSSSTASTLLSEVARRGGRVWLESGRLKYRLPSNSQDLLAGIRQVKDEIVASLSSNTDSLNAGPIPAQITVSTDRQLAYMPSAMVWPKPLPCEEVAFGLPVRRCPTCSRQMVWVRPQDPPHCVICALEGPQNAGKGSHSVPDREGGALTS